MRYDNIRSFEKHLEGAFPKHLSPVYLITGKESFECKDALELLLKFLIPKEQKKELTLSKWDGANLNLEDLLSDLYSLSFFVQSRVILIEQADKINKSLVEELEKYFNKSVPSISLVLTSTSLSKQTNFYKAIEKAGVILEIVEKKPWEKEKFLVDWVNKQAAAARKMVSYPVAQQLVKQAGFDQAIVSSELEKLFCYIGTRQEITKQDVESICTNIPSDTVWQLGEAIFGWQAAKALSIIHGLLMEGQPFLPLLRQLRSQFITKYQICSMLENEKTAADVGVEFPYMKGQILEKNIQSAREYGLQAVRQSLITIDEIEMRAKNSQDEQLLAEILIVKLTRKRR